MSRMFIVTEMGGERELLVFHVQSCVGIVVRSLGDGEYEPIHGVKPDEADENKVVSFALPSCFSLNDDSLTALRAFEAAG